jgi:hypothetical protein
MWPRERFGSADRSKHGGPVPYDLFPCGINKVFTLRPRALSRSERADGQAAGVHRVRRAVGSDARQELIEIDRSVSSSNNTL